MENVETHKTGRLCFWRLMLLLCKLVEKATTLHIRHAEMCKSVSFPSDIAAISSLEWKWVRWCASASLSLVL
eukprot:163211-Ditylum_brightwellii.AAC.1